MLDLFNQMIPAGLQFNLYRKLKLGKVVRSSTSVYAEQYNVNYIIAGFLHYTHMHLI